MLLVLLVLTTCIAVHLPQMLTESLLRGLQEVRGRAEEPVYHRLVGHCAEICVLRYLLLLRKRVEQGNRFTTQDIQRFCADVAHFDEFFEISPRLNENGEGERWMDHGCTTRCIRAISTLQEASDLLSLQQDGEPWVRAAREFVRR